MVRFGLRFVIQGDIISDDIAILAVHAHGIPARIVHGGDIIDPDHRAAGQRLDFIGAARLAGRAEINGFRADFRPAVNGSAVRHFCRYSRLHGEGIGWRIGCCFSRFLGCCAKEGVDFFLGQYAYKAALQIALLIVYNDLIPVRAFIVRHKTDNLRKVALIHLTKNIIIHRRGETKIHIIGAGIAPAAHGGHIVGVRRFVGGHIRRVRFFRLTDRRFRLGTRVHFAVVVLHGLLFFDLLIIEGHEARRERAVRAQGDGHGRCIDLIIAAFQVIRRGIDKVFALHAFLIGHGSDVAVFIRGDIAHFNARSDGQGRFGLLLQRAHIEGHDFRGSLAVFIHKHGNSTAIDKGIAVRQIAFVR